MIKVPIVVLNDPKEKIGSGFINEETGEFIQTGYVVDQDSIYGDGVYDALMEVIDSDELDAFYGGNQHDRFHKINRKLSSEGLNEISPDSGSADRLREFCLEHFNEVFNEQLEFDIIFFHSLHDAEQNNLEKALIL